MATCTLCGGDLPATVLKCWVQVVSIEVPSANKLRSNHGGARFTYKALRGKFKTYFEWWAREDGIPRLTGRPRVTFIRQIGKGRRAYDRINWAGGCKPVLDALALAGILPGDTEKDVDDYYGQATAGDGIEGIKIIIEVTA